LREAAGRSRRQAVIAAVGMAKIPSVRGTANWDNSSSNTETRQWNCALFALHHAAEFGYGILKE
jgi:hypothetical protein